jgi:hypothetical protein
MRHAQGDIDAGSLPLLLQQFAPAISELRSGSFDKLAQLAALYTEILLDGLLERPLQLVIEDLDTLDPPSLRVLGALASRLRRLHQSSFDNVYDGRVAVTPSPADDVVGRSVIVATARQAGLLTGADGSFRSLPIDDNRSDTCSEGVVSLKLAPLSDEAVGEIARTYLGSNLEAPLVALVVGERTELTPSLYCDHLAYDWLRNEAASR